MKSSNIHYHGVSEYIPYEINSFTQDNINQVIELDERMPDIDEILKVSVNSKITYSRLVKTATGTSLEGQHLTGWKYITEGYFNIRIDYCGTGLESSAYTYKSKIFFNSAITLNEDTHYNSRIIENIFIEDIFSQELSQREFLININFLFTAENC